MLSVSFDSKSLLLPAPRGAVRRFPVVAVAFDAVLADPATWEATLAEIRSAGFNTVSIRVPWMLHEPTPGRFDFSGACDLRRLLGMVEAAGLKAILWIGPCVGGSFANAGMPAWIAEFASGRVREANPAFLSRLAAYWRRLAPEFAASQATRNGASAPRSVIAVGIEHGWRSLDASVGEAYFAALGRFAREVGIEVPLLSANNCWFVHHGVVDAWTMSAGADTATTALELREVQADAPPFFVDPAPTAVRLAGALAARADAVVDALPFAHARATAAIGEAQRGGAGLAPLARVAVFASSFGEIVAGLLPDGAPRAGAHALRGAKDERVTVVVRAPGAPGARKSAKVAKQRVGSAATHVAADGSSIDAPVGSACGVDIYASDLSIAGSRLERSTGSLVALLGDLVVVAGRARGKIRVKVDGSEAALTVAADGAVPKVSKVRGLRVMAVPFGLADGVRRRGDGLSFVDPSTGAALLEISADGVARRVKPQAAAESRAGAKPLRLGVARILPQDALLDGTHARFASVDAPRSLGSYGVVAHAAYYAARVKPRAGAAKASPRNNGTRLAALPFARLGEGRVLVDGAAVDVREKPVFPLKVGKLGATLVVEVRAAGFAGDAAPLGALGELRAGVFGGLVELAPMPAARARPSKGGAATGGISKGVLCERVPMPVFDGTTVGRFVPGYESRDPADADGTTLRWTFAPRASAVVVRFPRWWIDLACGRGGVRAWWNDALRLNGTLVAGGAGAFASELVWLDGALLSPMRPKAIAKGEKPPRGRNVKLEPGANEFLLDLAAMSARPGLSSGKGNLLDRLRDEVEFHEVLGEFDAAWSFARIDPPASWVTASEAPPRAPGKPAWFRTDFRLPAPRALEVTARFERGRCASVWINGECVIAQDGTSGAETAKTRGGATCLRTARVPERLLRAGENDVCVFDADGAMPKLEVRVVEPGPA